MYDPELARLCEQKAEKGVEVEAGDIPNVRVALPC